MRVSILKDLVEAIGAAGDAISKLTAGFKDLVLAGRDSYNYVAAQREKARLVDISRRTTNLIAAPNARLIESLDHYVMQALGNEARFCEPKKPWAGWHSEGRSRPLFVICKPYDGHPHHPGNGQMVAFAARDRKSVDSAYEAALQNGGISEGAPGLRPEYHANYYGAYFRDPEGNKLCVATHGEE